MHLSEVKMRIWQMAQQFIGIQTAIWTICRNDMNQNQQQRQNAFGDGKIERETIPAGILLDTFNCKPQQEFQLFYNV